MRHNMYPSIAIVLLAQFLTVTATPGPGQTFGAAEPQNSITQIKESNLSKTPIEAGGLRITITKFDIRELQVVVENTSASSLTFSPARLEFVGNKGNLVSILSVFVAFNEFRTPIDRDLPPGSHFNKTTYELNDVADLPARLYYDRQLIAEIVK